METSTNKKVALVTGGISGIGKTISLELAKSGYCVYATTRSTESPIANEIKEQAKSSNLEIRPIQLDLSDSQSIKDAVSEILEAESGLDVLVNNAASGYFCAVEDIEPENFLRQIEINVLGTVKVIQAVLPQMRKQQSGKIINISSIMGFSTAPLNAPYSASKYALESISETLALEVKPFGIDVVILQLGDFHSNFLKNSVKHKFSSDSPYFKLYKRQEDKINAGGIGKDPSVIATKIVSICNTESPALRYMIGKEVYIKKFLHLVLFDGLWVKFLRFFYKW